jgi:hypothetical protein
MSDLLQTIQDTVANESTPSFADFKWSDLTTKGKDLLWPEVCKRYAFEVAKDALKNASENGKVYGKHPTNEASQKVIYANPSEWVVSIDKSTILDESNIKL